MRSTAFACLLAASGLAASALTGCREGFRPGQGVDAGAGASGPPVPGQEPDPAAAPPPPAGVDTLAVLPGVRLGPVRLGAPFDSLLVTYGQPPRSSADTAALWGAWPRAGGGWLDVYAASDPSRPGLYRVVQVRAEAGAFTVDGIPLRVLTRALVRSGYRYAQPHGASGLYDRTRGLAFAFSGQGDEAPVDAVVVVAPGTPASALRSVPDGP